MTTDDDKRAIQGSGLTASWGVSLVAVLAACSSEPEATKYYAPLPGSTAPSSPMSVGTGALGAEPTTPGPVTPTPVAPTPTAALTPTAAAPTTPPAATPTAVEEPEAAPPMALQPPGAAEPTEPVTPEPTDPVEPVVGEPVVEEPVDLNPPAAADFDLTIAVQGLSPTIDTDSDGQPDGVELDTNGDGTLDAVAIDTDDDAFPDTLVRDTDDDGVFESVVDMPQPSPPPTPEPQPCNFEFTVQTGGGNPTPWSPNNYGAFWMSDDSNGFIRTFEVWGTRHIRDLGQWGSQTGSSTVDAISGATLSNHQSHTVTWDCTNLQGELVPFGTYVLHAEVTEGGAGPYMEIPFEVGPNPVDLMPADQTGFSSMRLTYSPGGQ